MDIGKVKALCFDVFGTVVDWRGSIVAEGEQINKDKGLQVDWAAFADAWRGGYRPAMDKVRNGELPWLNIDSLHRRILDGLLPEFGLGAMSEAEREALNRVWHRLRPWPDAVAGLARLRRRFVVCPLSNGNVSLLVNMAKAAGLDWDCVLSAELARRYKPDPQVYRQAAHLLGLAPGQVMMVAAHNGDLKGARAVGFATAFVLRPAEYGPQQRTDLAPDPGVDVAAADFEELARQLLGSRE